MKKKIVALFVCITMVAALAGCASSSNASATAAPTEAPVVTVEKEEPAPEVKEPEVVVEPEEKEPEVVEVEEVNEPEEAEVTEEAVEEEPEDPNADLGIAVDYLDENGVLDLEAFCTKGLGAQKFYIDDEMFCFVFDDAWFVEGTLSALNPTKYGVVIGSWETQSNKASFVHVSDYNLSIFIDEQRLVPRDVIRLLPTVVEYMKKTQDPKTQPSIEGMDFQAWPESDPYLATFKNL